MKEFFEKINSQPFVSIILLGINLLVYLLCMITGNDLYDAGYCGVWDVLINQEYDRIIGAMFLHNDPEHLFSSMMLLGFMGSMLEKAIGHIPYTVIYFLSGIGGNILSLCVKWFSEDWSVSLGASGALFGLDGLLLAMALLMRDKLQGITLGGVLVMIALSLYSGFTGIGVDNAGHIGGLMVGFLLGVIVCAVKRWKHS